MKRIFSVISLVAFLSVICAAQKVEKAPRAQSGPSAERSSKSVSLSSGARIEGELQGAVDAKNSHVGDQVVLKTTKAVKQDGQVVIPKGADLIGRITEIQQRSKDNAGSRIGLLFDRVRGQNLDLPINANIVSITNAAANARLSDMADADIMGSSGTSASSSSRGSSGSSGGGLLGGVTSTVGSALDTTTQTAGSITNTARQTVAGTTGSLGRTVNGIQISNSVDGSVSSGTTLSAANKNVRLEKGVLIQLQLNSSLGGQ
jgi:hypothetical protein